MTVRYANVKGIDILAEPMGSEKGGVAIVSFDLLNTVYTGGTDTVSLGGGGSDGGVATTSSLATIMQLRRRDGKTVVLTGVSPASLAPGNQSVATNGPAIFTQAAALSGTTNVTGVTLNTAPTGGSAITSTAATWERAAQIVVTYTAT